MRPRLPISLSIAVVALAAFGFLVAPAAACVCIGGPERERFDEAHAAVVVEHVETIPLEGEDEASIGGQKQVYRLRRVYKGPPSLERRERLVLYDQEGNSCGLDVRRKPHGLYLGGRAGRWWAGACSDTGRSAMRRAAKGSGARSRPAAADC